MDKRKRPELRADKPARKRPELNKTVSHMQWYCYTCGCGGTAFAWKMKLRACFHIARSHITRYTPIFVDTTAPSTGPL